MDRTLGAFRSLIERFVGNKIVGPRMDYTASYDCTVVTQNGDGTLELKPDDSRIPPASSVPIRYGVPGVTATVANGARVTLAFLGADPAKPIATVWGAASVTALVFNGGSQGVARVGDAAAAGSTMATWISGVTSALGTLGQPVAAPLDFGTISGGSAVVKAG